MFPKHAFGRIFPVSQDPGNYNDAPTEGIRRVLEKLTSKKIPRGTILGTDKIGRLVFRSMDLSLLYFFCQITFGYQLR